MDKHPKLLPYKHRTIVLVGTGARRDRRIEMRTDAETERRIVRAAELAHLSVSAFILGAARVEADRVLADHDTRMPADEFDQMIASLDVADPAPVLERVARGAVSFER